jgi:hypothetical protein
LDAFLAELRERREPAPAEDRLFHLAAVARAMIDGWAARGEAWPETLAAAAEELSRASADALLGADAMSVPQALARGLAMSVPQAIARGSSGMVNPNPASSAPLPSDGKRAGGEGVAALAEDLETLRDLMRDEGVPGRVTARFDALLRKLYRERPLVANNNDAMESVSAIGVRVGERRFAVEARQWVGVHADHGDAASRDADRAALRVRGADYEIVRAQRWSDADGAFADRARSRGVYALLRDGGRAWALEVDEVLGELRLKHTRPVPSPEFPSWPRVGMDRLDEEWPILDAALIVSPAFDNPPVVEDAEPETEGRPSLAPLLRALSPRGRRGGDPGT